MDYLPSPKVAISGILLVACVAMGLWFAVKNSWTTNPDLKNAQAEAGQADFGINASNTEEFLRKTIEGNLQNENSATNNISKAGPGPKTYSATDLKLETTNNPQKTAREYGLHLASILKPFSVPQENEANIMLKVLDSQDPAGVVQLARAQQTREKVVKDLLATPVPITAAKIHLDLVNSVNKMAYLLDLMSGVLKQPTIALESGVVYINESQNFLILTQKINQYFKDNGVVFNENEQLNVYINLQ